METLSKWQKVKQQDAMSKALFQLLDHLYRKEKRIPNGYQYLLKELAKETPISQLLASYDKLDYQILKSFLKNETRISNSFGLMKKLKSAFPILIKIILAIMNEEGIAYNLPDNVTYIFQEMVNLRISFDEFARKKHTLWITSTMQTRSKTRMRMRTIMRATYSYLM